MGDASVPPQRDERDAERVREDVSNGLVSRKAAERDYGVVLIADGAVDAQATRRRSL